MTEMLYNPIFWAIFSPLAGFYAWVAIFLRRNN